ncbi:acyltransferase family protein [Mucilaginibacter dorajii]|nr:acyltransferase [Mucilaginibacter dorajii]MCS3732766.1 peptidoglycan/LPS O-acetylase OafA/YrhL [Mucilaginibacter dorajii]
MGFIRFLLACAVVLAHTSTIMGYSPVAGNLAVQCFYIISGFYMAMVLTEKYNKPGASYQFYTNRALKIYPAYWLNLILLIFWAVFVYHQHYPGTLDFYTKYAHPSLSTYIYLILANLLLIGLDWVFLLGINKSGQLYFTGYFNSSKPSVYNFAFNGAAWTIGVELAFYLIAPWLNKRKNYILLTIFLLSLGLRLWCYHLQDGPPWDYMFFPTQLIYFIGGMFSYRMYAKYIKNKASKALLYLFYGILLCVVLLYYQFFEENYAKQIVLFLCIALCIPFAFELTKKSRIDRFLGNLSYPIYIGQSLIIKIVSAKRFPKLIDVGFTAVIIVIVYALIVQWLLNSPIEKYRAKRIKNFNAKTGENTPVIPNLPLS